MYASIMGFVKTLNKIILSDECAVKANVGGNPLSGKHHRPIWNILL